MAVTPLYNSMDSPEKVFPPITNRLIFVGAGDLASEVFGWMAASSFLSNVDNVCFIDDSVTSLSIAGRDLVCLGSVDNFYPQDGDKLIATISSPIARSYLVEKLLARGCDFLSFIDPSVKISVGSVIGCGCIVLPYALISTPSGTPTQGDYDRPQLKPLDTDSPVMLPILTQANRQAAFRPPSRRGHRHQHPSVGAFMRLVITSGAFRTIRSSAPSLQPYPAQVASLPLALPYPA